MYVIVLTYLSTRNIDSSWGNLRSEGCSSHIVSAWVEQRIARVNVGGVAVMGEALVSSTGGTCSLPQITS
jgi:hypothetical protein